jgi:spermidine/putrescine ABC transporter ATP-binding subunit
MPTVPSTSRVTVTNQAIDVQLVDVSKSFGGVGAVHAVSLQILRGEFFSLLGPSGCGKTTTLRMIGGFETPSVGQIFLRGKPINGVPPHRRATNMVFQQMALFPHLSVFENVAFGLRLKRMGRNEIGRRVVDALTLVSLQGFEARLPNQLSGGQQQRVAIARALVNEPAVLLLDEPLGALDLKLRLQMQTELKALQARLGTTFIYVTHDQGEALALSDRLALMNAGRVEQVGTPQEIYEHPRTKFVARFVGETNLLRGVVRSREGSALIVDAGGTHTRATLEGFGPGDQVLLSIRPEHIRISAIPEECSAGAQATIRAVVYQGSLIRYTLDTAVGDVLSVDTLNGDGVLIRRPGDRVSVSWNPERMVVLPP